MKLVPPMFQVIPNASRMWKFQRYKLILEYRNQRPVMFPPFNMLEHFCKLVCICLQKCCERCCKQRRSDYKCVSKLAERTSLSLRHKKKIVDEKDKKAKELLLALERKSFNKVLLLMLYGPDNVYVVPIDIIQGDPKLCLPLPGRNGTGPSKTDHITF